MAVSDLVFGSLRTARPNYHRRRPRWSRRSRLPRAIENCPMADTKPGQLGHHRLALPHREPRQQLAGGPRGRNLRHRPQHPAGAILTEGSRWAGWLPPARIDSARQTSRWPPLSFRCRCLNRRTPSAAAFSLWVPKTPSTTQALARTVCHRSPWSRRSTRPGSRTGYG